MKSKPKKEQDTNDESLPFIIGTGSVSSLVEKVDRKVKRKRIEGFIRKKKK